jgi:hypothetical protein
MNQREQTLEIVRRISKLLYRPIYTSEYNTFVYRFMKQKLEDKERQIQVLIDELREDKKALEEKHREHMEELTKDNHKNPLQ